MTEKGNRIGLLREEPIPKGLIKLGLPTMIGMLITALYNLVDVYFVGRLGTIPMAAVAVVYPFGIIILGVGLLFGSGAASSLSRLLGDNQYEEANRYGSTALWSALLLGFIMIGTSLIILEPLLRLLGATPIIMPYAKEYALIFNIGLIVNLFNIVINNMIVAEGASQISMRAMVTGCVLNIILDPLFIILFGWGVQGAAWATLLSRSVTAIIYLFYLASPQSQISFKWKHLSPKLGIYKNILKIGIPFLFFQLLTSVSMSLTNSLASSYGEEAIASLGIVTRIMSLWSMALFGFLKGYLPMVGYNYGAKQYDRVQESTKLVLKWSNIYSLCVGCVMIVFAGPVMKLFAKGDPLVLSLGTLALMLYGLTFCGFGYQAVYSNLFLALGRAKEGGLISICRQGLFFVPLIVGLSFFFQWNGIIVAQPLADVMSLGLLLFLVHHSKVKEIILGKE